MKRIGALLPVVLLLFVGCTRLPFSSQTPSSAPSGTTENRYESEYANGWAYAELSADQRRNYGAVYAAVKDGFSKESSVVITEGVPQAGLSVTLPVPLRTEEQIRTLYDAVVRDNPAFFHLGSVYGYDGRQYGDERRLTELKLTYTMAAEERVSAKQMFDAEVDKIMATVPQSCSAFQAELILHDAVTDRCRYATAAAEETEPLKTHPSAFTAYGALVEGEAVCEGYSYAMQYLLAKAGFFSAVVTGQDGNGNPHMWNAVLLDELLYYVDVTWDDADTIGTYTYFNLTEEELLLTHTIDDATVSHKVAATDGTQNYYRMTDSYLNTLSIEDIAEQAADRFSAGQDTVHLRFSTDSFGNALFFVRSARWFTDTVNDCLPAQTEPLTGYTFGYNETYKTITICKKTS